MGIRPGRQRGQLLVTFAIVATAILAVVGLLFSFGLILAQRRSLQTAADAASLAGTWLVLSELQNDSLRDSVVFNCASPACSSVVTYAQDNGVATVGSVTGVYVDASGNSVGVLGSGGTFPATTRGVRVTLNSPVVAVLPGFAHGWPGAVQASATAALRRTDPPAAATLVVPVAVALPDFQAAYGSHVQYDLFNPTHRPANQAPTLNFLGAATNPTTGATAYGALAASLQYWSDGQHLNGTLRLHGTVALAGGTYFDSISAGLVDNVTRQAPPEQPLQPYALILVPIWDTADSTAGTIHIYGFAQMKLLGSDISALAARGVFVPFAASAGVSTSTPAGADLGAALVQITS